MDGNQKFQAPGDEWRNSSEENHPSLIEPSLPAPQIVQPVVPSPVNQVTGSQTPTPRPSTVSPVSLEAAPAQLIQRSPIAENVTSVPDPEPPEDSFYRADPGLAYQSDMGGGPSRPYEETAEEPSLDWVSSGESLRAPAAAWRVRMTIIAVILGVIIYAITRDFVSSGAVLIAGVLFGFLGARKPQALAYRLDAGGLTIGQKHYGYDEFRAFSVADDRTSPSVELAPLKRFLPIMSLQLDPELHDQIISMLSSHLPMEAHSRDAMDHLTGFLSK